MNLLNLDEKTFKSTYIATFLASYMAVTYERNCSEGHVGEPYAHQPIEDANHLADCAWESLCDLI